jgi:hypothetical protein
MGVPNECLDCIYNCLGLQYGCSYCCSFIKDNTMTTPTFQELLTSQEARFTNKQLEVWAGLGPWHVEQEINIENEFDDPDGDVYVCHPKTTCETTTVCHLTWNCTHKHGPERQTNAALIAAAPALAATLLAERKAREVDVAKLKAAIQDIAENWKWWDEDRYDRCSSVVGDSIAEAEQALKGGERS